MVCDGYAQLKLLSGRLASNDCYLCVLPLGVEDILAIWWMLFIRADGGTTCVESALHGMRSVMHHGGGLQALVGMW